MFAHWTDISKSVLQDEVPPVFHLKKRKMDDITEVSDFSPIGRRAHIILVEVLETAGMNNVGCAYSLSVF